MRIMNAALAAAVVLFAMGTVHGQDHDLVNKEDVRCLIAASILQTAETSEATRGALMMSALYHFGRIDGRERLVDLSDSIKREMTYVATVGAANEFQRCLKGLKSAMSVIDAIAKTVSSKP